MNSLPPTTLRSIAEHIREHKDLFSLRAVCRYFNEVFKPIAFDKTLVFKNTITTVRRLESPTTYADIASCFTGIEFALDDYSADCKDLKLYSSMRSIHRLQAPRKYHEILPYPDTTPSDANMPESTILDFFDYIIDIDRSHCWEILAPFNLDAFTNINSVHLRFPAEWRDFRGHYYQEYCQMLQSVVLRSFAKASDKLSPTTLTIDCLQIDNHGLRELLGLVRLLAGLKVFKVGFGTNMRIHVGLDDFSDFWLRPVQANVEVLKLWSEEYVPRFNMNPTELQFRRLRELELFKFFFSASNERYDIENIIVSAPVALTLQKLVLTRCAILIPRVGSTSGSDRTWADILHNFRIRLIRLKRFEPGKKLNYKLERSVVRIDRMRRHHSVYHADVMALLELWESIGQRQSLPESRLIHYFE